MYTMASVVWGSLWKMALGFIVWMLGHSSPCDPLFSLPWFQLFFFCFGEKLSSVPDAFTRTTKGKGFLSSVLLTTDVWVFHTRQFSHSLGVTSWVPYKSIRTLIPGISADPIG